MFSMSSRRSSPFGRLHSSFESSGAPMIPPSSVRRIAAFSKVARARGMIVPLM